MTRGFIPPKAGFSLVEVIIAVALLVLSLAAFTVSFVQARRSAAIADNSLNAINVARQQMETVCSSNYSAISTGKYFSSGVYTGDSRVVYTGSYSVCYNTNKRVKDIALTVKWVNAFGKITSTVALASSISSNLHQ